MAAICLLDLPRTRFGEFHLLLLMLLRVFVLALVVAFAIAVAAAVMHTLPCNKALRTLRVFGRAISI